MRLHEYSDEFRELITIVARSKNLPESAVERDYYIVRLLHNLAISEYAGRCVFKGGTSLSKCYPGSIDRFSEDIDLTYLGESGMSDKLYSKHIKRIEAVMTVGANTEKIDTERNDRSKSMLVWFGDKANKVKLEIGSTVRPDPYAPRTMKCYIHEFLESIDAYDDIERFGLVSVEVNVLSIERTFIDKIMSVKRHAICGTIKTKARHIYDVTRLFTMPEIKAFLEDKAELKRLVRQTKETDSYYLGKRNIDVAYDPTGAYGFDLWRSRLDDSVRDIYESLHEDLLYTNEKQSWDLAVETFEAIDRILQEIME